MVMFHSSSSYVTRGKLLHPCFLVVWDKIWDEIWNDLYFLGLLWWKLSEEGVASLHLGISGDDRWRDAFWVCGGSLSCGKLRRTKQLSVFLVLNKKVFHACSHMLTQKKKDTACHKVAPIRQLCGCQRGFIPPSDGGIGRRTDWVPANSTSRNTTRDEYNGAQHTACHRKNTQQRW